MNGNTINIVPTEYLLDANNSASSDGMNVRYFYNGKGFNFTVWIGNDIQSLKQLDATTGLLNIYLKPGQILYIY